MRQLINKVTYFCDNCRMEFGDHPHLSIDFNRSSGWVRLRGERWKFDKRHGNGGIRQFCNEKCLADFFKEQNKS